MRRRVFFKATSQFTFHFYLSLTPSSSAQGMQGRKTRYLVFSLCIPQGEKGIIITSSRAAAREHIIIAADSNAIAHIFKISGINGTPFFISLLCDMIIAEE